MIAKLLTEHHLEFLNLKGGCRGSSESTHVTMSHYWKSHALAYLLASGYGMLGIPEVIMLFHTSWSPTNKPRCIIHVFSHAVSYE